MVVNVYGADPIRVAYTLEQCWHPVPGGTAVASLAIAEQLMRRPDIDVVGVAGRHRRPPVAPFVPPVAVRSLPIARPWLYDAWNRFERPLVERATGPVAVCHSTTVIPAATRAAHVVTIHDVAFVHSPERFTGHGARVMKAGLDRCRTAEVVTCPSDTVRADLLELGFGADQVRVVPWGVHLPGPTEAAQQLARTTFDLPDRFVLFVGTIEPRKNLERLAAAIDLLDEPIPLVVVGATGWGAAPRTGAAVRFLGFLCDDLLSGVYAAATVCAYPSIEEGFGMPVLEAMAHRTAVVTSRGTATEEAAGGAAVLVDPLDVDSIAAGITAALQAPDALVERGFERASECTWEAAADLTIGAYRDAIARRA